MDLDQTAHMCSVCSESTLFVKEVCRTFQQTIKQMTHVLIGALRVKT